MNPQKVAFIFGFTVGGFLVACLAVAIAIATAPDRSKDAHGVPCTISEECQ